MNLYDTKQVCCTKCGKFVGEIETNIRIVYVVCENCQNSGSSNRNDLNQKNQDESGTSTMKQNLTLVN